MDYPRVAIIVVNWNKQEYLLRCLESLYQITYPSYDVIVVDNASEDDSLEKVKEWAEGEIHVDGRFFQYNPDNKPINLTEYERADVHASQTKRMDAIPFNRQLIIIKNEQNYGFAKANNIGISYVLETSDAEYCLLINNDCVVSAGFLDELVRVARAEPDAGILAPKIYAHDDPDGELWSEGGLLNYWTGTYSQRGPKLAALAKGKDQVKVDWVPMCCALISRQAFQAVGLLDEAFFWGMEELDFAIRLTKQGFKVFLVPKSEIWHDNEHPPGYQRRLSNTQVYNVPKNQLILLGKHWHGLKRVSATLFFILRHFGYLFNFLIRSRKWHHLRLYAKGLLDYWKERKNYR